jgi:WhiB family redox-sensing transcriptional regulator
MVNSYYGIYQAERGKTAAGIRAADAQLSLVLPCTEDPELFFAESPQDVEQAKAMCRGCRARLACLADALEREEPWGVWGGELLMSGTVVPCKRPRGRPRKDFVTTRASVSAMSMTA